MDLLPVEDGGNIANRSNVTRPDQSEHNIRNVDQSEHNIRNVDQLEDNILEVGPYLLCTG